MSRIAFLVALLPAVAWAGSSNSLLDVSTDGKLLLAANNDNGTVTVVDLATKKAVREIPIGKKPEGVTFLGSTHAAAATAYGEDVIVLFNADTGESLARIDVFDEPYGIISNADGTRLWATLEYPGQVIEIDPAKKEIVRTIQAGSMLRGLALAADEKRLYVTEYLSGIARAIDVATGSVVDSWALSGTDNLARQIALHPTRPKAYVPHIRSRVNLNQGEGSVVPFVAVIDTAPGEGTRRTAMPMDQFYSVFVVANPWEVALSPDGKTLVAAFAGTDDLYVTDVLDDNYLELKFRRVLRVGHNPRAVKFSPDGESFFVYNVLDFEVDQFDAKSLRKSDSIKVCENPLSPEVHRGKVLFYTALQPMVGRRWISCSSCHPDGDADGRTWQNPEGLRNTTALYGMAWTHPLHWSADRDETQDFEHTIRGQLMQGRGLTRGRIPDALGEPLKGKSEDLDALAAYSNQHKTPLSPHAKQGLSEAAKRGKELFFSEAVGCAQCHSGPYYTDSRPTKPYNVHDIGTGRGDKSEKMGTKYDTPSLLNVYRTAPYFHDGTAATLMDVLTTTNEVDQHGKTSHLQKPQLEDLVEFLKSLPYEDPEPAGRDAGLVKIDR